MRTNTAKQNERRCSGDLLSHLYLWLRSGRATRSHLPIHFGGRRGRNPSLLLGKPPDSKRIADQPAPSPVWLAARDLDSTD